MHRTEGEDYILEDGKRRFAAADLPSQKATRLPAEFMNALQEEISNVVTAATNPSIALNDTATADRTAGWNQLLKALQEGHIIKGTSFATTALADGLTEASGFTASLASRTNIAALRAALPYGFGRVTGRNITPANKVTAMEYSLAALAQAFGCERTVVLGSTSDGTLSLAFGETYGEDWDTNVSIILASDYAHSTLTITGLAPHSCRITIINLCAAVVTISWAGIESTGTGTFTKAMYYCESLTLLFDESAVRRDLTLTPGMAAWASKTTTLSVATTKTIWSNIEYLRARAWRVHVTLSMVYSNSTDTVVWFQFNIGTTEFYRSLTVKAIEHAGSTYSTDVQVDFDLLTELSTSTLTVEALAFTTEPDSLSATVTLEALSGASANLSVAWN